MLSINDPRLTLACPLMTPCWQSYLSRMVLYLATVLRCSTEGVTMFSSVFSKQPKRLTINGAQPIEVQAKETILQAALRADVAFPHSCRVGGCAGCKCQLNEGKVKELTESSYILTAEELSQGYILACQAVPKEDVSISVELDTYAQSFEVMRQTGTITKQWKLTQDITALEISLPQNMPYAAGQFVNLAISGFSNAVRSYSFATAPNAVSNNVQLYIKHVSGGVLSPVVHVENLVGKDIVLDGPHGNFYLRDSDAPMLCIAGGSGLAPVKALLEQAFIDKVKRDVTFIFAARTQQDLYCLNEINEMSKSWLGSFEFIPVLSNEADSSEWKGERGYVTDVLPKLLTGEEQAYLCGPPPMIDAAVEMLRHHSVPSHHIFFDKFVSQAQVAAA